MGWKSEVPVAEAHAATGVEEQLLDERRSNVLPSTAGAGGGTWLGPSARKLPARDSDHAAVDFEDIRCFNEAK